MSQKTLDEAQIDFEAVPAPHSAADLLSVATKYWNDDMIGDETYADKVRLVRDWLVTPTVTLVSADKDRIADAARRIASYAEGNARINVYRVATAELALRHETISTKFVDAIERLPLQDDDRREPLPVILDPLHPEDPEGSPTIRLRFKPQAWINDYAVSVDTEHPDTWDVPLSLLLERFSTEQNWNDHDNDRDDMRFEGNAPKWVRDWTGPFEVELAESHDGPWATGDDA